MNLYDILSTVLFLVVTWTPLRQLISWFHLQFLGNQEKINKLSGKIKSNLPL